MLFVVVISTPALERESTTQSVECEVLDMKFSVLFTEKCLLLIRS